MNNPHRPCAQRSNLQLACTEAIGVRLLRSYLARKDGVF